MVFVNLFPVLFFIETILSLVPLFLPLQYNFHFYPISEATSVNEWLYNEGLYELIILNFLLGVAFYMDRGWEISFRIGMCPLIIVSYSTPIAVATTIFLIHPIGQGSFSNSIPLGISSTFNFMVVF